MEFVLISVDVGQSLGDILVLAVDEHLPMVDDDDLHPHRAEKMPHLGGDIPTTDDEAVGPLVDAKRLGAREELHLVSAVDRVGDQRPRPARQAPRDRTA